MPYPLAGGRVVPLDKHFLQLWEERFPKAAVHRFDDCRIIESTHDRLVV